MNLKYVNKFILDRLDYKLKSLEKEKKSCANL